MSSKKLHDILNPNNINPSPILNKSPLSGSHNISPVGGGPLGTGLLTSSPSYHTLPQGQNIFYNPTARSQEQICPSPMIQAPFRFLRNDSLPTTQLFQQFQAPEPRHNQGLANNLAQNNDLSESLHSILVQLQTQSQAPSRNLQDLLQRSFSSMPSNSVFQNSFTSAIPSPFLGHNTPRYQGAGVSASSQGINSGLFGTPRPQSQMYNGTQMTSPDSNDIMQNSLITQLADILKQESETKIKSAIIELLKKSQHISLLTDKILGKEFASLEGLVGLPVQNSQLQLQQQFNQQNQLPLQQVQQQRFGGQQQLAQAFGQPMQKESLFAPQTINLQGGLVMNPLPRFDEAKSNMDNRNRIPANKIEAARKGLFVMEPTNEKRSLASGLFESQGRVHNPTSIFGMTSQSTNPTMGSLHQQMGQLNLGNNWNEDDDIDASQKEMAEQNSMYIEAMLNDRASTQQNIPGIYTLEERKAKILKYKGKIYKHRNAHPVNRTFEGRSTTAGKKPRIKGKFVKMDEYLKHVKIQEKEENIDDQSFGGRMNWTEPIPDENLNESTTYNESERSIKSATKDKYMLLKEEAF